MSFGLMEAFKVYSVQMKTSCLLGCPVSELKTAFLERICVVLEVWVPIANYKLYIEANISTSLQSQNVVN